MAVVPSGQPIRQEIAPPLLAVLPSNENIYRYNQFPGFQPVRSRPESARPPQMHVPVAPYPPHTPVGPQPGGMLTYEDVDAMINARMREPHPALVQPIPQDYQNMTAIHDSAIDRLTYEAGASSYDIASIEEQLNIPHNAQFGDLVYRARTFDKPVNVGGWHPMPPPAPPDPEEQEKFPMARQVKNDLIYRPRVRRANIPHDKQRTDASQLLKRRIYDASHVLGFLLYIYRC